MISWAAFPYTSSASGNWSDAATWSPSVPPVAGCAAVVANGHTVTLDSNQTNNVSVTVNSGGTLNTGANTLSGTGSFTLASGGTLGIGSPQGITTGASGNVQMAGTRTFSTGANYTYNGSSAQVTGDGLPIAGVNNLTINNAAGVSLSQAATVNGTLSLLAGLLDLDTNDLTLGTGASITVASPDATKMIIADGTGGRLCKQFAAGNYDPASFLYPIGDNTAGEAVNDYAPGTLDFNSNNYASGWTVCMKTVDAVYPNKPSGPTSWITRYWTAPLTAGSLSGGTYSAQFQFVSGEKVGTDSMDGKKWDDATWVTLNTVSGTTFTGTNLGSLSNFTAYNSAPPRSPWPASRRRRPPIRSW